MEYEFKGNEIIFPHKELTLLDKLVIDFISRINLKYVIVSGYVAILFGRSRNTEDVDIFIEIVDYKRFEGFFENVVKSGKYYCINADNPKDAYEILSEKSSIRFAEKGTFDPNFEIKFPEHELHNYSLDKAIIVKLGDKHQLMIGPIELQLAYKLKLGSEKDYEDAAHLYIVFKKHLNREHLKYFISKLGVKESVVKKIFGEDI